MRKATALVFVVLWMISLAPSLSRAASELDTTYSCDLVNQVKKSVVAIWTYQTYQDTGIMLPYSIGSGVIFMSVPEENAAYALTNHHVAGETTMLQIELWDNSTYLARMVATEPGIDTALIRIDNVPPDAYEVAVLGDSDAVQIGELALAMGAPGSAESGNTNRSDPQITFGLHSTATMRVVTGKSRDPIEFARLWAGWKGMLGNQVMTNTPWTMVVQTAINGGNSGGPLFNMKGECIGLNHASHNTSAEIVQNYHMTIPINFSRNFAMQILDTGSYELAWFGMDLIIPAYQTTWMNVQEFTEKYYDREVLRVFGVRRDSPAEAAGLQRDDIIVEFDGRVFQNIVDLRQYIFSLPIGKQVPVIVERRDPATGMMTEVEIMMESGVKRTYDAEFSL